MNDVLESLGDTICHLIIVLVDLGDAYAAFVAACEEKVEIAPYHYN